MVLVCRLGVNSGQITVIFITDIKGSKMKIDNYVKCDTVPDSRGVRLDRGNYITDTSQI